VCHNFGFGWRLFFENTISNTYIYFNSNFCVVLSLTKSIENTYSYTVCMSFLESVPGRLDGHDQNLLCISISGNFSIKWRRKKSHETVPLKILSCEMDPDEIRLIR